jgi:NTP pyrophosphatase (non-canonical NTP hydrolase)
MPTTTTTVLAELPDHARGIFEQLNENGFTDRPDLQQVLCLAEEAGEFVGAYRRYIGMARRTGPFADVETELADVVITAFVTAEVIGVDLAAAIAAKLELVHSRGWREQPTEAGSDAGT